MKWSWKLGRIAGIDVKIHLTFALLLVWIGFSTVFAGGNMTSVVNDVLFVLALFLCVVLHEFGHALTARLFGVQTQDITLLPIGGVARLEKMPEDPKEEFLVAVAGPAVNLVIAGAIFVSFLVSGVFTPPIAIATLLENFWVQLLTANLSLFAFNLIPAFPMDGGRVLRAILGTQMTHVKSTRIAANVGRVFAVLMGIAGIFINPWLILTAIFVWSGAGAEANSVEIKAGLQDLIVRDAMISQFYRAEANQTLDSVFQLSMQTGKPNIPVVSNGHFLGIIRRNDLISAMERLGKRAPAYAAIVFEPEGLDPEMPLIDAAKKFTTSRVLPVIENDALIGLITPESIKQRIWLKRHEKKGDTRPQQERADSV